MSSSRVVFLALQHVLQAVLSGYALRHSYVAITNLQKYEGATKKLASWSQQAQDQLNKTRTTQGAGAIAALVSFAAAVVLPFPLSSFPPWTKSTISASTLALVLGARHYIKGFWAPGEKDSTGKDKGTKIPLPKMEDYNLAVQKTEDLLKCLEYLEYSWLFSTFLGFTMGWA